MTPKFVVDNSIVNSGNPGSSPVWHIDNGCVRHFGSGLESGLGYLEKDLRPTREAIRFMLDLIAQDLPQAQKVSDKDFWDLSLLDEIKQSGFIDQLQKN